MNLFNFIKANISILDVVSEYSSLKKAGLYWKGNCPFHNEKTASFTVSPHKEIFYCFGCNMGGDVISFIEKVENCSPIEAANHLVERYKLNPPANLKLTSSGETDSKERNQYYDLCKAVSAWAHSNLLKNPTLIGYLQKRGFSKESITSFSLGYFPAGLAAVKSLIAAMATQKFLPNDLLDANILSEGKTVLYSPFEDRLIFPIKDHLGRFCAFGGRIFKPNDERPKYYNSRENEFFQKGSILFGLDTAKKSIQDSESAFLVEGYTDCIAMVQYGYKNTIATLGTACTPEHLKQLARYAKSLYVLYDADKAGHNAMLRLTELCWQVSLELKVIYLPEKEDPASFLSKGGDLKPLIAKALDIFVFFIDSLGSEFTSKPLGEKIALIRKLVDIVHNIDDPLKREILLQKASKTLDMPLEAMQDELERSFDRKKPSEQRVEKAQNNELLEAYNPQKLEKMIFCAIINNMQLLNINNEKYLLEYLPSPLRDILKKLKYEKDAYAGLDFLQFFDKLNDKEKLYVSSLLLENEEETQPSAFEQLLLQLHKKNWKVIVHDVKKQLDQAKKEGDTQKVEKILQDFQTLKQTMVKNFV